MNILNGNIEEAILTSLLKRGSIPTTELLESVVKKHACTRQGFYRALRKLRAQEHIVVYKSLVSVNGMWLRQLRTLVTTEENESDIIGDFSKLTSGDSLSLRIKGLVAMDRVWSHLFTSIEDHIPTKHPLFLYNPHNWSALLRQESDRLHEEFLRRRKRAAYLMIGSANPLDKEVTKSIDFKHIEFSFNPQVKREEYVATIGEYVIELRLSPKTRSEIHKIFTGNYDTAAAKRLLQKLDASAVCKIQIERNASKARQWERRIGKDFHVR